MTFSTVKSMKPIKNALADVVSYNTRGFVGYDSDAWDDAMPKRKAAKAISVVSEVDNSNYLHPHEKYEFGYRFGGDFKKVDGAWTGEIEVLKFLRDGKVMGVIDVESGVDIGRVVDVAGSGLIWNEVTATGLKGTMSKADDDIHGSVADDVIKLGKGDDRINASLGDDLVRGGGGDDTLDGFDGDDRLFGGGGDDRLIGLGGDDRLVGGRGSDLFERDSQGVNTWKGGKGGDFFEVASVDWNKSVNTTVVDFNAGQGDKLDLSGFNVLTFNEVDEIRYIGDDAFSTETGVAEIRMEDGLVTIDSDGDGVADYGLMLKGLGHFDVSQTDWIVLPEDWVLS